MQGKINKSVYLTAAIYIALGIFMVLFPKTTMKTFCFVLAAIIAVIGLISVLLYFRRNVMDSVYRYDFVNGVCLVLLGVVFCLKSEIIINIIPIIMGMLIFGNGVIKLQHAIDLKRIQFNGWLYVLIFSLLCISVGIVFILQPAFIASTVVIIIGISFIFCGITDLITIILLSKKMKDYAKEADEKTKKEQIMAEATDADVMEEESDNKE